jgi:RNA-binding protein
MTLTGEQRRKLKSMAHNLNPMVQIGKKGLTEDQIETISKALFDHELIKVKFNDFKSVKDELSQRIADLTGSDIVDVIGNTLILYKMNPDPSKREISLA